MDIMTQLGASVTPLPGGEVYLALERGVIDAAEFSTPAMNYPLGFDEITKYVIQPGVHQPSVQCAFFINKDAWNKLPADLKWIVDTAAKETQLWSTAWQENLNVEAIKRFKQKVEFVRMDDETITAFAKQTKAYLDELKAKHPDVKKVLDSQDAFRKDFAEWREIRSGVTPWPMDDYISGKRTQ
jgi:TRAP-type mannitol/chloroaromatic compound transport system substrate-binding protein